MGNVSGWTEGIILSLVALTIMTLIIVDMNANYNKDYSLGLSDNTTEALFVRYQGTAEQQIKGGDVQLTEAQGITLKSSFALVKDSINIVWIFVSGGWIEKTAEMWNVGESGMVLAKGLRIIYFLSLVFALLYGLFKVVL